MKPTKRLVAPVIQERGYCGLRFCRPESILLNVPDLMKDYAKINVSLSGTTRLLVVQDYLIHSFVPQPTRQTQVLPICFSLYISVYFYRDRDREIYCISTPEGFQRQFSLC